MLCTSQDPHERVPHRDPRWLVRLQLWSSVEIQSEHLLLLTLRKDLGPALLRRPPAASPVQAAAAGELFFPLDADSLAQKQPECSAWKALPAKSISPQPSLGSKTARRMCPDRFGADKILFIFNC